MRAVVLKKPYSLEYTEIPIWPIEEYNDPDLMLVKVRACGICGSDFRYYQGENPWAQHTLGRHIENPPNIVLGHEFAGEVVAVLSAENNKWLGKRVVPICSKVCGKCEYCTTNRAHLCEQTIHMGHGQGWGKRDYYPGAYAEYVPAWGSGCYEVPEGISFEETAMMDVLAVCTHAYNRANHPKEEPLLIIGCGPIGNGIGQVAKISGVANVNIVILENSDVALKVAQETGFHSVINTQDKSPKDIKKEVFDILTKKKPSSVFDSVGTEFSFKIGLELLEKSGSYVNLAVHDSVLPELNQMQLSSERTLTTSSNFMVEDYELTLSWLGEKKFKLQPWMEKITLESVPKRFKDRVKSEKLRENFKLVIIND